MGISVVYIELLYRPLLNLMVIFYNNIPGMDIGLAVLGVTLVVKFALLPLSRKSIKSQRALQKLQPQLNAIKNKFKHDKEKQSKEMMKFYKENKINPFSSCLPILIQLPILWALYRVFRDGIGNPEQLQYLYSFVNNPGSIDPIAFGLFDFSERSVFLAILAGILQFIQTWMITRQRKEKEDKKKKRSPEDMAAAMTKQMTYFMPILTVFIAISLPSGLAFYWVVVTVFAIVQQWYIMRKEKDNNENGQRESKELVTNPN